MTSFHEFAERRVLWAAASGERTWLERVILAGARERLFAQTPVFV
jgi:hypothetical protein